MKTIKVLRAIAARVPGANPAVSDTEDVVSLCAFISRTQGVELILAEGDKVHKILEAAQLREIERYEIRPPKSINRHSCREYMFGTRKVTLDRTNDGVPPFFTAHDLTSGAVIPPYIKVDGKDTWGDGLPWREAEATLLRVLQGEAATWKAPVIMKTCWQCRGVGVSRYSDKNNMCGVCHGSGKVPNDSYPNGTRLTSEEVAK